MAQAGIRPLQKSLLSHELLNQSCQLSIKVDDAVRSLLPRSSRYEGMGSYSFYFHSNQTTVFLWARPVSYSFFFFCTLMSGTVKEA